ncbi:UDP-N-acetylmuramate--L-alanine ligase [Paenibacillus thermoaerophilus]
MSAIAKVLLEMGFRVTGSDVARAELTDKLAARGAQVFIGHDEGHVRGADMVVYSTALSKDNVELSAAERLNIPTLHRSQMLARLLNARKGIAVAGAHGKTTTSSMIAHVLERSGFDPTYLIGGEMLNVGSNARAGRGEYVVAEADESDGSFLQYRPQIAVVTNIEADHLENYEGDFAKLRAAYEQYLSHVKPGGQAVVCVDDPYARELADRTRKAAVLRYGMEAPGGGPCRPELEAEAREVRLGDRRASFELWSRGSRLGCIELFVPGRHNVYNALAAYLACREAGVAFAPFAEAIRDFRGAKRRFQVVGEACGVLVVDDYAHHPTEIEATIEAARATGRRIWAVFQPQRYTRTYYLMSEFGGAFGGADEVLLTDIYSPAGERRIEGVDSAMLAERIRASGQSRVRYLPSKEEILSVLANGVASGDLVLTMGAGDIWKVSHRLAQLLKEREEGES